MFAGSHRPGPVVALWLLPIILGCGKSPVGPGAAKSAAAVAPIKSPDDVSLPAEEYLRLGVPAWDRDWSAEDMTRAADILAPEAPKIPPPLPRFESKRSGEVFARLVSPSAFALDPGSVPVGTRLTGELEFSKSANRLLFRYAAAFEKKEVGGAELVEFQANHFRTMATLSDIVDELLPTIDKNDPSYATRMQGLDQMRRGLAGVVSGGLMSLTERQNYRVEERIKLIEYFHETLPPILPRLTPASRTEMLMRLDRMDDDPDFADLQPALGILRKKAHAAVAAEPAKP